MKFSVLKLIVSVRLWVLGIVCEGLCLNSVISFLVSSGLVSDMICFVFISMVLVGWISVGGR